MALQVAQQGKDTLIFSKPLFVAILILALPRCLIERSVQVFQHRRIGAEEKPVQEEAARLRDFWMLCALVVTLDKEEVGCHVAACGMTGQRLITQIAIICIIFGWWLCKAPAPHYLSLFTSVQPVLTLTIVNGAIKRHSVSKRLAVTMVQVKALCQRSSQNQSTTSCSEQ